VSRALSSLLPLAASLALVVGDATAQTTFPALPFARTTDFFVSDSTNDCVWRLQDLDQDGDFNDAGEVLVFYDDVQGTIALTNNIGVAVGPDGRVFVCDSSADVIVVLQDVNGDGDALDLGEHEVFFDGTTGQVYGGNASGILLTSAQDLTVDAAGVVWVASANSGSGGQDVILRLEDGGGLPGANDIGEATVFADFFPGGATGASIPTDVQAGPDGFLYYVESGTGGIPKGIYRLRDDDGNGNANGPGEVEAFFIPGLVGGASSAFHWGLAIDAQGAMYLNDSSGEAIWRVQDLDGSGAIDAASEAVLWYQAPGASLIWRQTVTADGTVWAVESQTPDRVLRLRDDVLPDGDVNDPGEVVEVYDETLAALAIGNPRSIAPAKAPTLSYRITPQGNLEVVTHGTVGDGLSVWLSNALWPVPIPVPPLGALQLDLAPTAVFGLLYEAVVGPDGRHTATFLVPNDPAVAGFYHFQALVGRSARPQLTPPLTVQL
jgi:hypothetical protein